MTLTKLMLLSLALISTGVAAAPPGDEPAPRMERHMERMADKLDLDEAQAAKFKEIMQAAHAQRHEVMQKQFEIVKPQMEAIESDTRTKLGSVLNEQQMEQYDQMAEKRKARWAKHKDRMNEGGGRMGEGGGMHRHGEDR